MCLLISVSYKKVGGRGVGSDVEPQAEGTMRGGSSEMCGSMEPLRDCMGRVAGAPRLEAWVP